MTHGRPVMIHSSSHGGTILPSAIDDELLGLDLNSYPAQPEDKPSTMAFYLEIIKLSDVLSQILTGMYLNDGSRLIPMIGADSRGHAMAPGGAGPLTLLHLDKDLHRLREGLPPFLRPTNGDDSGGSPRDSLLPHDPVRKAVLDMQSLAILSQ